MPFSLKKEGLERAYIVGGGYKYCKLGPGNAFLRFPADTTLRPVFTGWFSEFTDLSKAPSGRVEYGPGPARFAEATYDFTSHYRGARVFKFFEEQELTVQRLRELSLQQIRTLTNGGCIASVNSGDLGGFLAIAEPRSSSLHAALRAANIWTDYRANVLRLGPAPYVNESQLSAASETLGQLLTNS